MCGLSGVANIGVPVLVHNFAVSSGCHYCGMKEGAHQIQHLFHLIQFERFALGGFTFYLMPFRRECLLALNPYFQCLRLSYCTVELEDGNHCTESKFWPGTPYFFDDPYRTVYHDVK